MNASKFTDAQKAFIIKQVEDGTPVAEVCREARISQATYFNWKKKHATMRIFDLERKATVVDDANLRHPMGFARLDQGPLKENKAPELDACASQNAANEFRAHRYSLHAPASEFVAAPIVDPMAGQEQTSKMTRECIEKPASED